MALVEDSFCESEMYCVNNTHVCSCAVVSKNRNPAAVTPAFFNLFCPPFFNADVVAVVNPAARNNACASNRPLTLDPGLVNAIQTQSGAFRGTSTGKVGLAKVSVEAVFQFPPGNFAGQVVYWRVE